MTLVLSVNPDDPEDEKIETAAKIIKKGGLVAFPTETVYGLGADALNSNAVRRIFKVKQRPADNPLIIHVSNIEDIHKVAELNETAGKLIKEFFPGPISLIMKKTKVVPYETTAGLEKVAVRMPNHKVALKLIDMSETPIVAPSANIAGKPSPTNAKHVLEDLDGKIEAIIDSGETTTGLESTVVDTTVYPVEILRPGPITPEMLEKVVKIEFSEIPSARYTHYAPKAELIVVSGDKAKVVEKISELISELNRNGLKVGLAVSSKERYKADLIIEMGELEAFARNLFPALREFDRQGVDVIVIEGVEERGIGVAVMNRLKKAASKFYRV